MSHNLDYFLHLFQIFWLILFFYLTYFTVSIYFCKKISKRLVKRKAKISNYINLTEKTLVQCQKIKQDIEKINDDIKKQSMVISENAHAQAKKMVQIKLQESKENLTQMLINQENHLLKWQASLMRDITKYMAEIEGSVKKYIYQ